MELILSTLRRTICLVAGSDDKVDAVSQCRAHKISEGLLLVRKVSLAMLASRVLHSFSASVSTA
jgi:hypothetical protein